jgi:hypothetical protein
MSIDSLVECFEWSFRDPERCIAERLGSTRDNWSNTICLSDMLMAIKLRYTSGIPTGRLTR